MKSEIDISYNVKSWIIVGVVSFVTFLIVFLITHSLVNGNKDNNTTSTDNTKEEVTTYKAYEIGDEVTLKNDTKWNVLYESSKSNQYVTLLSVDNVNTDNNSYSSITNYLKGVYRNNLLSTLSASTTNLTELRLLAYIDLEAVSGTKSSEFKPNVLLKDVKLPEFIYSSNTITDTTYSNDDKSFVIMISTSNDGNAKFEATDMNKALPVRPVIIIDKKFINNKVDNTKEVTNNEKVDGE